jgi:UDP-N-acetylglucosamine 2-epimerase (non-hydrolysing)
MHREENVDSKARLTSLVETLNHLAARDGVPVIVSTHPRTRNRLDAIEGLLIDPRVQWSKPFGFHDYNALQLHARCAISDSGTIAEESTLLGFPAITPRDAIERPEALDTGGIIVTGLHRDTMIAGIDAAVAMHAEKGDAVLPDDYRVTNTSERVTKLILGTARLSNAWDGIRVHDYV